MQVPHLLQWQTTTAFDTDVKGRLLRVNERSVVNPIAPPPLVYILRSPQGNCWGFRTGLPESLLDEAERLLNSEPVRAVDEAPPRCRDRLIALFGGGAPLGEEQSGPCFVIQEPKLGEPDVVQVTTGRAAILRRHFPDVLADLAFSEPCVAKLEGGDAVSVCFSARRRPYADAAGVVTLPHARGRGYATAVTAGWAALVQAVGKLPLYSTDWENRGSQAVAHKLRARLFASEWLLTDAPPRPKNHP